MMVGFFRTRGSVGKNLGKKIAHWSFVADKSGAQVQFPTQPLTTKGKNLQTFGIFIYFCGSRCFGRLIHKKKGEMMDDICVVEEISCQKFHHREFHKSVHEQDFVKTTCETHISIRRNNWGVRAKNATEKETMLNTSSQSDTR